MEYDIDIEDLLLGFDVEEYSEFVYYDSYEGIASVIDSESGELLVLETLH